FIVHYDTLAGWNRLVFGVLRNGFFRFCLFPDLRVNRCNSLISPPGFMVGSKLHPTNRRICARVLVSFTVAPMPGDFLAGDSGSFFRGLKYLDQEIPVWHAKLLMQPQNFHDGKGICLVRKVKLIHPFLCPGQYFLAVSFTEFNPRLVPDTVFGTFKQFKQLIDRSSIYGDRFVEWPARS